MGIDVRSINTEPVTATLGHVLRLDGHAASYARTQLLARRGLRPIGSSSIAIATTLEEPDEPIVGKHVPPLQQRGRVV